MPVTQPPHDTQLSDADGASTRPRGGGNYREGQPQAPDPAHAGLIRATPRETSWATYLAWLFGTILAIIAALACFALFQFVKFKQAMAMKEAGAFDPPPAAVTTFVVHPAQWQPSLHAIGSLEAVQGTNIAADLPGIVKEIHFESGQSVKKGDILVRLVTDQEQAQLEANQAQRDLAVYTLNRQKELREKNTNSKSDFDNAEAGERQMEAMVDNARATIDRKTLRAPFTGVLGIRGVNVGQYLNSGDFVVTLQAMDPIYVNFTLPQQNLKDFGVGSTVEVRTDATGDQVFTGKVTAVNALVDAATRNFQAQATLANPDGKLRPGMFATADVLQAGKGDVLPVPGSAISYAPYGNSVFVIAHNVSEPADPTEPNGKKKIVPIAVVQKFVKTGQTKGDMVAVLSGLKDGEEIVSSGVFKLQNNAAVQINNAVKPEAETNPHPEES